MGAGPAGPLGPPGPRGEPGPKGADGTVDWSGLTEAQRKDVIRQLGTMYGSQLKGDKGDKGVPGVSDPKEVVGELKSDTEFMDKVGEYLMGNSEAINTGIVRTITKSDDLRNKITTGVIGDPTFTAKLGETMASNPNIAKRLKGQDGKALDPATMNRTYAPLSVWCGEGEMCRVPGSGSNKDRPNFGIDFGSGDGSTREPNAGRIIYGGQVGDNDALNIFGKGTKGPSGTVPGNRNVNLYDNVNIGGNMTLQQQNTLQFGRGVTGQDPDAGKIGYRAFTEDLDIVGAGVPGKPRGVRVWDNLTVQNNLNVRNKFEVVNSTSGSAVAGIGADGSIRGREVATDESVRVGQHVYLGDNGYIQTGTGVPDQEKDAGRIGHTLLSKDALDIVGAGPVAGSRNVKIWDNLGVEGNVNVAVGKQISVGGGTVVNQGGITVGGGNTFDATDGIKLGTGSLGLRDQNPVEFGAGVTGKGPNAGKIAYRAWSDGLDIVGAGVADRSRKVKVWNNLEVPGNIESESRIGTGLTRDAAGALNWSAFIEPSGDMTVQNVSAGSIYTTGDISSNGGIIQSVTGSVRTTTVDGAVKAYMNSAGTIEATDRIQVADGTGQNAKIILDGEGIDLGNRKPNHAGKISFGDQWGAGHLHIVGKGATDAERSVKIWNKLNVDNINLTGGLLDARGGSIQTSAGAVTQTYMRSDGTIEAKNRIQIADGTGQNVKVILDSGGEGRIKVGNMWLSPADAWIRVLTDPGNHNSYDKGLAAKNLWAQEKLWVANRDILAELDALKAKTQKLDSAGNANNTFAIAGRTGTGHVFTGETFSDLWNKTQKLDSAGNATNNTFTIHGRGDHRFSGDTLSQMWNKTQKQNENGDFTGTVYVDGQIWSNKGGESGGFVTPNWHMFNHGESLIFKKWTGANNGWKLMLGESGDGGNTGRPKFFVPNQNRWAWTDGWWV